MIVETSLVALQAGQQLELAAGDTLRVTVSFDAAMSSDTTTELWVSLLIEPGRDYTIKTPVPLKKSATPLPYSIVVDMPITTTCGLDNLTYDLWAELPSYDEVVKVQDAASITGMPASFKETLGNIGDMISLMIVMMMMSMMMEQTRGLYEPAGTPSRPKPVTEAAVKGAKKAAEYGGKAVKRVIEYYREGEED